MSKSDKWPSLTRKVASDSFVLQVGGHEYKPHKGEWVKLKSDLSSRQIRDLTEFYLVADELGAGANPGTARKLTEMLPRLWQALAEIVIEWSWCGRDGESYAPPSAQSIAELGLSELMWLIAQAQRPIDMAADEDFQLPPSAT